MLAFGSYNYKNQVLIL